MDMDAWEAATTKVWTELMPGMHYRGSWKGEVPHGAGVLIAMAGDIGVAAGWMNMGKITGMAHNIKPNGNYTHTPFVDGKKNGIEKEECMDDTNEEREFENDVLKEPAQEQE